MIVTMLGRDVPENDWQAFQGDRVLAILHELGSCGASPAALAESTGMTENLVWELLAILQQAGLVVPPTSEGTKLTFLGRLVAGIGIKVANPDH